MEGKAALRWARALVLASVLLGSGVAGHAAAGGQAPATSVLIPFLVLLTAATAPLLDAPASTLRLIVLMGVGQGVVHAALQVLGGAAAIDVAGHSLAVHAGAAGGPATSLLGSVASTPNDAALAHPAAGHAAMLLGHVAAAFVVGFWLAAGERAAWTLVSLAALPVVDAWVTLRRLSGSPVTAPVSTRPRPRPCWSYESSAHLSTWSRRGVSRRGPPRLVAA